MTQKTLVEQKTHQIALPLYVLDYSIILLKLEFILPQPHS